METETGIKPFTDVIEKELCRGGHKVDGKTPMLQDIHLDGRTCDCSRLIYRSEGCGCDGKKIELHAYPNQ